MSASSLQRLVRQLRRTAGAQQLDVAADADLLQRFRADGDPEAFEAIVRRYGPCVLSRCRKVLSSQADVEDAFQATFVTLLQNARCIRQPQRLGGWLGGVAHRVAVKALANKVRRERVEKRRPAPASETPDLSWREACAVLHEELDRLPDTYRLPLILCYLEGQSRDEAAVQLGVKPDALRGRLARGRERLRERLTRRGVLLSAGLLAVVAADSVTAGGPPETLLRATLQVATTGRVPAKVAALLQGASPTMTLGKSKLVALAVLALGLLSAGLTLAKHGEPPPAKADPTLQPAPVARPDGAPKEPEKGTVEVSGKVLDPDGKAAVGAKLFLIGAKRPKGDASATTDADGKFRFTVKPEEIGSNGRLIAAADGAGADWIDFSQRGKGEVTLRLRKDDGAFTGRVVTLEGQPVAGATVEAERLGKPADGDDLTAWIDNNVKQRKEDIWINEKGLLTVAPTAFGPALTATTDKDGKFRLTGAGHDRVLSVRVRGEGVEHKFFWVVTRPDVPKAGYIKTGDLNHGLYGLDLTVLVGPSRPIVGKVTDAATGQPIKGVKVVSNGVTTTWTDGDGKYRLEGVPKTTHYRVSVAGGKDVPYFDTFSRTIDDTAGFTPLTMDFTMHRGLEITGRVIDKATGLPVPAEIDYRAASDNPNLKKYIPDDQRLRSINSSGRVEADGSYWLLAIPGTGVLTVTTLAPDRYPVLDAQKELERLKVPSFLAEPVQAVVAVNADEKKPESLVYNIELQPGKARPGIVVGPDDKPLEGVKVAGLIPGAKAELMKTPTFELPPLSERKRILLFLLPDKKLGAVAVATGDADERLTVKLQPLGSLTGQVVDADGKAWPGLKVLLTPVNQRRGTYDNLPLELRVFQGVGGYYLGLWSDFIGRTAVTDADGRFKLESVLPGVDFVLYVSDGDLAKERTLVLTRNRVQVEADKAKDLGTLKKD